MTQIIVDAVPVLPSKSFCHVENSPLLNEPLLLFFFFFLFLLYLYTTFTPKGSHDSEACGAEKKEKTSKGSEVETR